MADPEFAAMVLQSLSVTLVGVGVLLLAVPVVIDKRIERKRAEWAAMAVHHNATA